MGNIFKKPKNIKYTDMAIWIDSKFPYIDLSESDQNQMFEYLYHLAYMLAYKAKYFINHEDYDGFAIATATRIYFRILNPKQYIIDSETGQSKLEPIKSCLNYMKSILYPCKVEYQNLNFAQTISKDEEEYVYNYNLDTVLSDTIEDLAYKDFELCLGTIDKSIKDFLKHIPYNTKIIEWNNIYLSCLLSFLNMITIRPVQLDRIWNLSLLEESKFKLIEHIFEEQGQDSIILFHLDDSMYDYIKVLVNELKQVLAEELSVVLHTSVSLKSNLNLLALAEINADEYNED